MRLKDNVKAGDQMRRGEIANIPGGVAELYLDQNVWKSRILFMQDALTGLSTELRFGNKLILGSWFDKKILICPA